jgi:hypothetical protein
VTISVRKTLPELLERADPAWPEVQRAVADSQGRARILPTTRERGERTLVAVQYTTRSFLGAIAYESGGLVVDHGWLRILGAGGPEMATSLVSVNRLEPNPTLAPDAVGFIVAIDVLGGIFVINTGDLPGPLGQVFYLEPDTLEWLDLERPYSGFVQWALAGDLQMFYANLRWPGWQQDLAALPLDQGLHVMPPLFAKPDPAFPTSRRAIPIDELGRVTVEMHRQLEDIPNGAQVRITIVD